MLGKCPVCGSEQYSHENQLVFRATVPLPFELFASSLKQLIHLGDIYKLKQLKTKPLPVLTPVWSHKLLFY